MILAGNGCKRRLPAPLEYRGCAVRVGVSALGIDGTVLASIKDSQKMEKLHARYFDYLTPVDKSEVLVVPMSAYDPILGIPWFNAGNPEIDWERKN